MPDNLNSHPTPTTQSQSGNIPAAPTKANPVIAYFCMEFALDNDFGIYSGGLGVLAGDVILEAGARQTNFIGVGLAYALTYTQIITEQGRQREEDYPIDPAKNGFTRVENAQGEPVVVTVPVQDREVQIGAWHKMYGTARLILLDTNLPENDTSDQHVTNQLYVGDREHRLLQEIVLGIGGVKMLHALGLEPDIYHMNEGHSALLSLEVASYFRQLDKNNDFEHSLQANAQRIIFTNHTLVSAGRDVFAFDLVSTYLAKYAESIEVSVDQIIKLGKIQDSSLFSMNMLALRSACKTNAVSQFHAEKAQDLWKNHHLIPITNGIYFPRWVSPHLEQTCQKEPAPSLIPEWWTAHQAAKKEMIQFVQSRTARMIPEESIVFTWARRFVEYKRPLALFWQLDWLAKIIKSSPVHLHFIFGGKLHPHNEEGKDLMSRVVRLCNDSRFSTHLTFIPNYNLEVAKYLVQGSDVWLNTPIEGYEACGTSGMKAALNGVLQCSTNDGWVREVDWQDKGWILDSEKISESLYETIEKEVIPLYMKRDNGLPVDWVTRMMKSSQVVTSNYTTYRMLGDYYTQLYSFDKSCLR